MDKIRIDSSLMKEFLVRSFLDNPAIFNRNDVIRFFNSFDTMCDHNDCFVFC